MAAHTGLGGLGDLLAAGLRALSRYTGTLFAVFLVQSIVAGACIVGVAIVLAETFARLPIFDEAVDGSLVALLWVFRHGHTSFLAIAGVVIAALALWQLATWFLAGGIYGVLSQRPESRGDTARCFGASGAATYLAYFRLALVALPGYVLVLATFTITLSIAVPRLELALSTFDLLSALSIIAIPTGLLLHFFWTVTDYARVELTLRHETHHIGALATYFRSLLYVLKRPLTLAHGAVGWLLWLLVTVAYAYLAHGNPMYGATGAITLFLVRQGVSLLRMAIRVAILAGQVELGRTRPLPAVRIPVEGEAPPHRG